MLFHLHKPRPPLDRFVEIVTYYEGFAPDHSKEKLLPDGAVEIIVDLTDTPKKLYDCDDHSQFTTFRNAWISGMRRRWIVIEAAQGASMLVIRFRPGGAYPFLPFGVEALNDTVEQLDCVYGPASTTLRDRILGAQDIGRKMQAVETWLVERARGRLQPNPVIEYVTGRLFAPAGIRVSDLVREVGYTERHVLNLFRRWVGLSPKEYVRIRRFQHLLHTVTAAPNRPTALDAELRGRPVDPPNWAVTAVAHGYYDQSHLVHDFREFSGLSPAEYAAAYRGLENYLPLE